MIGSERAALNDPGAQGEGKRRRGGPVAMLGLLCVVWVSGRAVYWESPFASQSLISQAQELFAESDADNLSEGEGEVRALVTGGAPRSVSAIARKRASRRLAMPTAGNFAGQSQTTGGAIPGGFSRALFENAHNTLWGLAMASDRRFASLRSGKGRDYASVLVQGSDTAFSPVFPPVAKDQPTAKRWSLDAWLFAREGSGAAPISQGRVPVYGASQAGAILQYRAAPASAHDPRVFVRAYRALIDRPESELAAGVSARPLARVPVRIAAEVRATDDRFRNDIRPAAYAVTEIPPIALPAGLAAEVYAGAGYVGGDADTAFVDGQAAITREVVRIGPQRRNGVRLSVGAGAWGGAQRDASRLDVGPTIRMDFALGDLPARVSVDWRERVGGDANPVSGIAATLSTRF